MTPSTVRESATTYDVIVKKRRRTLLGGIVLFIDLIKIDQITGLDVYILSDLIKLYHPLAIASQAPLFNFQQALSRILHGKSPIAVRITTSDKRLSKQLT